MQQGACHDKHCADGRWPLLVPPSFMYAHITYGSVRLTWHLPQCRKITAKRTSREQGRSGAKRFVGILSGSSMSSLRGVGGFMAAMTGQREGVPLHMLQGLFWYMRHRWDRNLRRAPRRSTRIAVVLGMWPEPRAEAEPEIPRVFAKVPQVPGSQFQDPGI